MDIEVNLLSCVLHAHSLRSKHERKYLKTTCAESRECRCVIVFVATLWKKLRRATRLSKRSKRSFLIRRHRTRMQIPQVIARQDRAIRMALIVVPLEGRTGIGQTLLTCDRRTQ